MQKTIFPNLFYLTHMIKLPAVIKMLFIGMIAVTAVSCTKDLTSLNNNPKAAVIVPSASVFLVGQKNLVDYNTTTSTSQAPFRVFAQTWTENTYTTEARYILSAYNAPDGWWNVLYSSILNNLTQAKGLFAADLLDAGTKRNNLIITDILQIYAYNQLVNTYGNIPYTESESRSIPFPKYDDAKTVFYDLLTRLDTCIAGLNTASGAMGNADQIYKGNIASWKKFAATLKLKMAMMVADTDPATAAKKVQEAVTAGVFQSNTDNAKFAYQASPTGNANPIWVALINSGRHDFAPGGLLVNTMLSWKDPRLPLYFTKDFAGNYSGGVAGSTNNYVNLSTFSAQWLAATYPGDILDYPETEFLLAEAVERGISVGGTAETHYNNGVTASVLFWGGTAGDASAYLAQPAVAYKTATGNYKQKIGYQKWIALANRGWDAWTEIRRLKYPDINTVSAPIGASGQMPLRFYYPTNEQSSNQNNWAVAVKAQAGSAADNVSTKLFWMQ